LTAAEEAIATYAFLFGPEAPLGANFLLSARGHLRLAQGRPADAVADLRECGRRQMLYSRSPAMFRWRPQLATALLAMGAQEEAATVAADGLTAAREWGAAHVLAEALHVAGAVSGGEAGLELIREAVDVAGASEAALEHARSLAAFGGALRRAGRSREAREPLRAALDDALRCGATRLAAQVQDELVSAGAQPRSLRTSGVTALTATERRMVETVAEGRTNREAAQALFVSEKTVETHLRHAYAKLGISSRAQLRAALAGPSRG
jgi:DNA-binding CsgD family transcriptional regulator